MSTLHPKQLIKELFNSKAIFSSTKTSYVTYYASPVRFLLRLRESAINRVLSNIHQSALKDAASLKQDLKDSITSKGDVVVNLNLSVKIPWERYVRPLNECVCVVKQNDVYAVCLDKSKMLIQTDTFNEWYFNTNSSYIADIPVSYVGIKGCNRYTMNFNVKDYDALLFAQTLVHTYEDILTRNPIRIHGDYNKYALDRHEIKSGAVSVPFNPDKYFPLMGVYFKGKEQFWFSLKDFFAVAVRKESYDITNLSRSKFPETVLASILRMLQGRVDSFDNALGVIAANYILDEIALEFHTVVCKDIK